MTAPPPPPFWKNPNINIFFLGMASLRKHWRQSTGLVLCTIYRQSKVSKKTIMSAPKDRVYWQVLNYLIWPFWECFFIKPNTSALSILWPKNCNVRCTGAFINYINTTQGYINQEGDENQEWDKNQEGHKNHEGDQNKEGDTNQEGDKNFCKTEMPPKLKCN